MKLIPSFLLLSGFVAFATALKPIDYRIILSTTTEQPKNCTTSGLFCETCTKVASCVLIDDNTYQKKPVKTCDPGQKCLNGKCTSEDDPFCDGTADLPFPCQTVGIFPDPFYCEKYVMCVMVSGKLQAFTSKCEDGLGFDMSKGICEKKGKGVCDSPYPIPLCKTSGQTEPLLLSQEYYTCKMYDNKNVLYPYIDVCPHGEVYDNFVCKAN